jgi:hypothetical protein
MRKLVVGADGDIQLPPNVETRIDEVAIYIPASIGTATVVIGWVDPAGTTVPYAAGTMLAGEVQVFMCGQGVEMVATITSYSAPFTIGYTL